MYIYIHICFRYTQLSIGAHQVFVESPNWCRIQWRFSKETWEEMWPMEMPKVTEQSREMYTIENLRKMATENSIIEHFRQKHTLKLSPESRSEHSCMVCGQHEDGILGLLYDCTTVGCHFFFHKSCSAIPPELLDTNTSMQHNHRNPFHPQHPLFLAYFHPGIFPRGTGCNACGHDSSLNFVAYVCLELECSFTLHVTCSFLIPTTTTKTNEAQAQDQDHLYQPNHHPHPLILCDPPKIYTYKCSCCCLPFDTQTPVYVCLEECKALLHKSCAELPSKLHHHPFHPLHTLTLLPREHLRFRSCWACRRSWDGFVYHCSDCNFYLDVACASLQPTSTSTTENNEEKEYQDQHQFTHCHPLILCHNKQQFPIPCHACQLPMGDSVCFCPTCHFLIHKLCAQKPRKIKHALHQKHTLTLIDNGSASCYGPCEGCFSDLCYNDFAFECSHCKFNLDFRCAFSKPTTVMSKIHHHPLAFFNKPINELNCNTCGQPCHTPLFRCVWCKLNLHVHCISPLPPTIKSKHCHPLTLTNSPIKDHPDEDDEAEFYCDACEGSRELAQPNYYCRECHYVAHPHCVASEIMRILEEEWSEQQSHRVAYEVEEPPSLVLKEFLSAFKVDETKEAQEVFERYRRDSQSYIVDTPKLPYFCSMTEENMETGTMLIMKMLVLKNEVTKMPWENWNSMSKLIKVNDYMILEKLAPILKALLEQYGDFIGKSGLSRKVKMLYIMIVCDAVHIMCNTKVVDATANLLLCWFHSFKLGQQAGFEIQFAFDHLMRVVRAHFCLQANIVTVDPNFSGPFVDIAKQHDPPASAAIDSVDEPAVIEQDGETNQLIEKDVSMKLDKIKLDEEIRKVDEEIREREKTIEEKRTLRRMWEECFQKDAALLEEMAGTGLL